MGRSARLYRTAGARVKPLLDTLVASDLSVGAKAFFVTLFVIAAIVVLGVGAGVISWAVGYVRSER